MMVHWGFLGLAFVGGAAVGIGVLWLVTFLDLLARSANEEENYPEEKKEAIIK